MIFDNHFPLLPVLGLKAAKEGAKKAAHQLSITQCWISTHNDEDKVPTKSLILTHRVKEHTE